MVAPLGHKGDLKMAEERKKTHSILLTLEGKNTLIELFDSALWSERTSSEGDMRVRIDGKWYCPMGKYTFLTTAAIGDLIARMLSGGEIFEEESAPIDLGVHSRVRVHYGECIDSMPMQTTRGFVSAPAYRAMDGKWYIPVSIYGGIKTFPCHDVEPVLKSLE